MLARHRPRPTCRSPLELQRRAPRCRGRWLPPAIDFVLPTGRRPRLRRGSSSTIRSRHVPAAARRRAGRSRGARRGVGHAVGRAARRAHRAGGFLDAALRALPREDTEQNVQLVTGYLDERSGASSPTRPGALPRRRARADAARAASHAPRTSSLKATYFTAFRTTATTAGGVAFLERVWRRQEKIPGLTLAEPDEADDGAGAGRAVGAPAAASILDEQRARFTNPDRKARFEFVMPALSAIAPRCATRSLRSLADVKNRRREPWVVEGLSYLNHPLRAADAGKHLRPALDLLQEIQRTGDIFFPKNWTDAVARRPPLEGGRRHRATVPRRPSRLPGPPASRDPPGVGRPVPGCVDVTRAFAGSTSRRRGPRELRPGRPLDPDLGLEDPRGAARRAPAGLCQPVLAEREPADAAPGGHDHDRVARGTCRPDDVAQVVFDGAALQPELARKARDGFAARR